MKQSERFYQLLEEMKATHDAKRHDYASTEDVFANFRHCEIAGIPAWKGVCVRISDKFSRIMGFAKKGKLKVKDESVKDTLIDMANTSTGLNVNSPVVPKASIALSWSVTPGNWTSTEFSPLIAISGS